MILHLRFIGCDISKGTIDLFDPREGAQRIDNTAEACAGFAARLAAKRSSPRFAAFYDRLVTAGKAPKLAIIAVA